MYAYRKIGAWARLTSFTLGVRERARVYITPSALIFS